MSPLLANIYLHYVLDLWVEQWRKRHARGDVIITRWADDFIVGFQYHADAVQFLEELGDRLRQFSLELHPGKTRLILFGRFAAKRRTEQGKGKPETFNFLGFTHICGKTKSGKFLLIRRTMRTRLSAKLREVKARLMLNRHRSIPDQGRWLGAVVRGHYAYYGVPTNVDSLRAFCAQIQRHWSHALRRRSQRHRVDWVVMRRLTERWLPRARVLHPWPETRFDARIRGRSRVR